MRERGRGGEGETRRQGDKGDKGDKEEEFPPCPVPDASTFVTSARRWLPLSCARRLNVRDLRTALAPLVSLPPAPCPSFPHSPTPPLPHSLS
ncbi:hypothetical protein [Tolypothrix sp. VBCCA 56010]|uniref:hypothetical protein n=1 Tax=Tolypothrix sp. VBCCA 56010 TaxID=3137731 RepID=UPI003D7EC43E